MPVPVFGYSVGDFIATIQLLAKLHQSLTSNNRPGEDTESAIAFVESMQLIFQKLNHLNSPEVQSSDDHIDLNVVGALISTANIVKKHVLGLENKTRKHHAPSTGKIGGSPPLGRRVKDGTRCLLWTFSVKDVKEMKQAIESHIAMMKLSMQLDSLELLQSCRSHQVLALQVPNDTHAKVEMLLKCGKMSGRSSAIRRDSVHEIEDDDNDTDPKTTLALQKRNSFVELLDANTLHQGVESLVLSF